MSGGHELILDRLLAAPRAAVWRCWTEPRLIRQWYVPAPWRIAEVDVDVRPGGACRIVMQSPEGETHPNLGVYLEVVPERRLVMTDAYTSAWVPSAKPFMTAIVELADEAGGTRYHARCRHWTEADRQQHEAMGFHEGWGRCADQLEALARTL